MMAKIMAQTEEGKGGMTDKEFGCVQNELVVPSHKERRTCQNATLLQQKKDLISGIMLASPVAFAPATVHRMQPRQVDTWAEDGLYLSSSCSRYRGVPTDSLR